VPWYFLITSAKSSLYPVVRCQQKNEPTCSTCPILFLLPVLLRLLFLLILLLSLIFQEEELTQNPPLRVPHEFAAAAFPDTKLAVLWGIHLLLIHFSRLSLLYLFAIITQAILWTILCQFNLSYTSSIA